MSRMLFHLSRLEDFSMLEVFRDGNTIEVWSISSIDDQRTMRYRYLLTVPPFLQGYSSIRRHGDPRGLAEVLDQDCKEVIRLPDSPWNGCNFEQVAQFFPKECDLLVDTQQLSGMQRQQIRFRLYLTARRQLLELLRRIKAELAAKPQPAPIPGDFSHLD